MKKTILLVSAMLFAPATLFAQFTPLTAKIKETLETSENGKPKTIQVKEGLFFRSSDGSVLKRWLKVDGDEKRGGEGELADNKNLLHFRLNYPSKFALQVGDKWKEPISPDLYKEAAASKLGDLNIEGIACRRVPSVVVWPDGRQENMGEQCVSIDYALQLRSDERVMQNGVTRHAIMELSDIRLGQEPDPKLFDITAQFKISRPDPQP